MGYKDELFQEMRNNPGKHLDISAPCGILGDEMTPATFPNSSRDPVPGALVLAGVCPGAGKRIREDIMDESAAKAIAQALGGHAYHSGGKVWLAQIDREDGSLVIICGDAICEYANEKALDDGDATQSIALYS